MSECRGRKFETMNDLIYFINDNRIKQAQIVNIIYNPITYMYILIYYTY